jgi:hypothetical protein
MKVLAPVLARFFTADKDVGDPGQDRPATA